MWSDRGAAFSALGKGDGTKDTQGTSTGLYFFYQKTKENTKQNQKNSMKQKQQNMNIC